MARRVARWFLRIALGLLVLALLGVGTAAIALHTDWGRNKVRAQIEAKLKPYFPAGARIGRLEGSVLGDFTLHDIELTDRQGRRAVTIRKVSVNVELSAWLDDEARLETLIVEGVKIELHKHGSEPPNVATMFQPNPDPLTFDVVLERLLVRDAALEIHTDGRVDHIDDFSIDGPVFVSMAGALDTKVAVRGQWRERKAPLVIDAAVKVDPMGMIEVPSATVAVGDVLLEVRRVAYGGLTQVTGGVRVVAPERALFALAPELDPPLAAVDINLAIAPARERGLALTVWGEVAKAHVQGAFAAQPFEPVPTIGGTLMIRGFDAHAVLPSLPSTMIDATAVVALVVDPTRNGMEGVRGTVSMSGAGSFDAVRLDRLAAGATLDGKSGRVVLEADGDGDLRVRAGGRLVADGSALILEDGRLIARAHNLAEAAQGARGRVKMAGALSADLRIAGRYELGAPRFSVHGTVDGKALRRDDIRLETLAMRIDLDGVPGAPAGTATATATGLDVGGTPLPDLVVTARGRLGGGYRVIADARDARRGIDGHLDANVTLGDLVTSYADVRLAAYNLRARGLRVEGKGGRIVVNRDRATIKALRGTVAGGTFAVDAVVPLARPDGATGEIALTGINLDRLRGLPGFPAGARGIVDVSGGLERGRAHAALALRDSPLGTFTASVDVIPPRRISDPAAWRALDRRAVKALHVEARGLDLAAAGAALEMQTPFAGLIDGELHLEGTRRNAEVHVKGLVAAGLPVPLDADVTFDLADPAVSKVDASATLRTIGSARVTSSVRVPIQLFDADAWRRLGLAAVDRATLQVENLEVDELMANRLGLGDVRGVFTVNLSATAGLRSLDATVIARELRGGPLVEPAVVTVEVNTDGRGTTAHAVAALRGVIVVDATVSSPIDVLAELRRGVDPERIPLDGKITIPDGELAALTRALGRNERLPGRVHGSGTINGSLAAPVAAATVVIENLGARKPRDGGPLRGGVRELKLIGRYERGTVHGEVHGRQNDGGSLDIDTRVVLERPGAAVTSVKANKFELRPIARLLPDLLLGVSGEFDSDLAIVGLDPKTVRFQGLARLKGVTFPIHDVLGVLREGAVEVSFKGNTMHATVGGKLESGTIDLVADAELAGIMPKKGDVDITVRDIELITASAPRLDGKLHADITYDGAQVNIKARLADGEVRSRGTKGRDLHPSGLPADLVFGSTAPGADPPKPRVARVRDFVGAAPVEPFLIVAMTVEPVEVEMPQLRGDVKGNIAVAVGVDGASIEGELQVERGDVELLERRYRIQRAVVTFDGDFDPLLNVQVERELAQLTLYASLTGRLSDPDLKLTSDPASYTEGQLLSFAISDTAAAPGSETATAASSLVSAFASQFLLSYITPILPVKLDVIAYEPATATSSGAVVAGRWFGKLLVLGRTRVEARPDENRQEVEGEYWINQRVLFEGIVGRDGIHGVDLLWTRRW